MWQLDKGVKNYTVTYIHLRERKRKRIIQQGRKPNTHTHDFSPWNLIHTNTSYWGIFFIFIFCHFVYIFEMLKSCYLLQCCTIWECLHTQWNCIRINWSHFHFNGLLINAYSLLLLPCSLLHSRRATLINYRFYSSSHSHSLTSTVCAFSFTN